MELLIEQYKGFDILLNVKESEAESFKYLKLPLLIEKAPLGNAGAVKHFIKELGDRFIATHVDVHSDLDPNELTKAHRGIATMTVKDFSEPKSFGVVTHEDGVVTGFTRKRLVNCGIYSFTKDVVKHIGEGFQDFDKDLFPRLIKEKALYLYEHKGSWEDIGTASYWKGK